MKRILVAFLIFLSVNSVFSLTMSETIQQFEEVASSYDNGEISVAQLVVQLENYKKQNDIYLKENNIQGWTESEVEDALSKYETSYGYVMQTNDLNIFLGAYNTVGDYYGFGYNLGGRKYTEDYYENQLSNDINSFKEELKNAYYSENPDLDELGREFVKVLGPVYKLDYDECVDLMNSIMDEMGERNMPDYIQNKGGYYYIDPPEDAKRFITIIHEDSEEECMQKCWYDDCENICENYPNKILLEGYCSHEGNYLSVSREGFREDFFNFVQSVSTARQSTPFTKECESYNYEGTLRFREQLQDSLNEEFFDWYINDFLADDMNKHLSSGSGFERLMQFFEESEKIVGDVLECKGESDWHEEFEKIEIDYQKGNNEFHVWEELVSVSDRNVDLWTTFYSYKIMPDKDMAEQIIKHQVSEQNSFEPSEAEKEDIKSDEDAMTLINMITDGFGESLDFQLRLEDEEEVIITRYVTINDDVIFRIGEESRLNSSIKELTESINKKTSEKRIAQAELRIERTSQDSDESRIEMLTNRISRLDSEISSLRSELNTLQNESFQNDFNTVLTFDNVYNFMNRMGSIDGKTVKGPDWANPGSRTPLMISERIGLLFDFWTKIIIEPWTTKLTLTTKIGRILDYLDTIGDVQIQNETQMLSEMISDYEEGMQE